MSEETKEPVEETPETQQEAAPDTQESEKKPKKKEKKEKGITFTREQVEKMELAAIRVLAAMALCLCASREYEKSGLSAHPAHM